MFAKKKKKVINPNSHLIAAFPYVLFTQELSTQAFWEIPEHLPSLALPNPSHPLQSKGF